MQKATEKVAILGAGITGLFTAYKLSEKFDVILIEKNKQVGGMSTSFKYKNFLLDYGPHKIYTELPGIIQEIKNLTPLNKIKKINSVYLENFYFNFPLQLTQLLTKIPIKGAKAGIDIFGNFITKKPSINYENFLINNFGSTIYSLIFKRYALKLWTNPKLLDVDLAKKRVAISNIFQLISSVLLKKSEKISADYFYYPKISISQLIGALEEKIKQNKGKILLNQQIKKIEVKNNKIEIKLGNKTIKVDYLISTIPLIDLVLYLNEEILINNAKNLSYKDTNIFYFILNKERALRENWIFFPELNLPFHRISEQKSFSEKSCLKTKTCLMVETTLNIDKKEIKKKLVELNIIKEKDIDEIFIKKLEKAYPIYLKDYKLYLQNILDYFDKIENIYLLGRHGLFNYNNIDQCIDMAIKLSNHLIKKKSKKQWKETRKIFDKYRIVD